MQECYLNQRIGERGASDKAFAGATHALSAVAIFLIITAFFPKNVYAALGSSSIWIIILTAINTAGSSLIPDLDNSNSTSKSSLGLLGDVLSMFFRGTSVIIQSTIRTSRDSAEPNPHRGAYHTIAMSILIGFGVYFITSVNFFNVGLPHFGNVGSGFIFALIISWLNLHMALAGLAKQGVRKIKKMGGVFGEVLAFIVSLTITIMLFINVEDIKSFWWLGVSVALGMIIHQVGDCMTRAGCPILFPIKIKGKLWYNLRFIGITSGGLAEHMVFIPFFGLLIFLAFLRIIGIY